ncbi:hypothetical protein EAPG_01501 [Escherichia albertii B156]|nr:hypothetical protein EAPG_01501 [Escherichia albertii B156]
MSSVFSLDALFNSSLLMVIFDPGQNYFSSHQ